MVPLEYSHQVLLLRELFLGHGADSMDVSELWVFDPVLVKPDNVK